MTVKRVIKGAILLGDKVANHLARCSSVISLFREKKKRKKLFLKYFFKGVKSCVCSWLQKYIFHSNVLRVFSFLFGLGGEWGVVFVLSCMCVCVCM